MKKILEITNQTPTERNEMLREAFFFWAGKHTSTKVQYQVVLCSRSIQNWFSTEYEKNEAEFMSLINRIGEGSVEDNNTLYNRMMERIYNIYPSIFLDEIKKKYNGIPIHNLN